MNIPFVDTDEVIEEITGKTIPEIFSTESESGFREIEQRTLENITHIYRTVILATG